MTVGALVSVGNLQVMPDDVRREVLSLQSDRSVGRRLAEMLSREGVDALHRSGELRKLVERLAPGQGTESEVGGLALAAALPLQAPVINKVAAGYPTEFTDLGYPARVADEYVSVPDVYDADAFAARVVGDSMSPLYHEGDIVVFSPAAATAPGSDCFVRFERDAETTFKRVYFERDAQGREMIRLQPLNASYPPRTVEREEVAGLYAAVYVVRKIGGGEGAGTRH
jgi:phage repressor protein C with HTH and peptisase S24 domain